MCLVGLHSLAPNTLPALVSYEGKQDLKYRAVPTEHKVNIQYMEVILTPSMTPDQYSLTSAVTLFLESHLPSQKLLSPCCSLP